MNLNLSWDLFIIVFFGLIVAYSLIIGRNNNLKVIIATYVAALVADAIGNLFVKTISLSDNIMKLLSMFYVSNEEEAMILAKVISFIVIIVLLAVKGAYKAEVSNDGATSVKLAVNIFLGFLNATLVLSIALIYVSGASFILGGMGGSPAFQEIYGQSNLAKILVDQYSIWFTLPAVALLGLSLFYPANEK